ncbi:hypothetical protein DFH09DRAFT_1075923 [Mycena vulgaris]|nr:hypothetical protein DFH09DRAFT_1075923 [Mycena vulgaris]
MPPDDTASAPTLGRKPSGFLTFWKKKPRSPVPGNILESDIVLPPELWLEILAGSPGHALELVSRVCKRLRQIVLPLFFRSQQVFPFLETFTFRRLSMSLELSGYQERSLKRLDFLSSNQISTAVRELFVSPYPPGYNRRHKVEHRPVENATTDQIELLPSNARMGSDLGALGVHSSLDADLRNAEAWRGNISGIPWGYKGDAGERLKEEITGWGGTTPRPSKKSRALYAECGMKAGEMEDEEAAGATCGGVHREAATEIATTVASRWGGMRVRVSAGRYNKNPASTWNEVATPNRTAGYREGERFRAEGTKELTGLRASEKDWQGGHSVDEEEEGMGEGETAASTERSRAVEGELRMRGVVCGWRSAGEVACSEAQGSGRKWRCQDNPREGRDTAPDKRVASASSNVGGGTAK